MLQKWFKMKVGIFFGRIFDHLLYCAQMTCSVRNDEFGRGESPPPHLISSLYRVFHSQWVRVLSTRFSRVNVFLHYCSQ